MSAPIGHLPDPQQRWIGAEAGKAGGSATAVGAKVGKGIIGETPILDGTAGHSGSAIEVDRVKETRTEKPPTPGRPGGPNVLGVTLPEPGLLSITGYGMPQFLALGVMMLVIGTRLARRTRSTGALP